MLCFPTGKINLGLNIVHKRPDGYHDLESVFYPIHCSDALEIIAEEETTVYFSGDPIPGDAMNNTCLRVANLMQERYDVGNLGIYLLKKIPIQAGLGGGSADASFLINLIDRYFSLGLSIAERKAIALEIGSDCPFFIENKPAYCTGRGEISEPIKLDLSDYKLYLIAPDVPVSTAWAYGQITPKETDRTAKEIVQEEMTSWKKTLTNDFEEVVKAAHPEIFDIKDALYVSGASYAAMSGSGSAFYGLFKKEDLNEEFLRADFPNARHFIMDMK